MDKLKIDKLNIYKSFEFSTYTIESAIAEFIENSYNIFNDLPVDNPIIIIYWDIDNNWIQVIDNGNGIQQDHLDNLFTLFTGTDSKKGIGLKAAAFWLGSKIMVESKNINKNFAFRTELDLDKFDDTGVDINFLNPNDLLRNFKNGTRVTIDKVRYQLNLDDISNLHFRLSRQLKNYISKNINILFTIIKDNKNYDIGDGVLKPINSLGEIKKLSFKIPEYNNLVTINIDKELVVNDRKIKLQGNAYKLLVDNSMNGVLASVDNHIMISGTDLYKPKWFNDNYKNILIEMEVSNIPINVTKNGLILNSSTQKSIDEYLFEILKSIKNEFPKFYTKQLVNLEDSTKNLHSADSEMKHLETSKLFLTHALDNLDNAYVSDFEIVKDKLSFKYNSDDGKKIDIILTRRKDKKSDDWLQLIVIKEEPVEQIYEYNLIYNVAHPFFAFFDNNKDVSHQMEQFVIAYAISETICRLDGLSINDLKYEISKLLKGFNNDIE